MSRTPLQVLHGTTSIGTAGTATSHAAVHNAPASVTLDAFITAEEYGDIYNRVTVLTISASPIAAIAGGAALGIGELLYTFPTTGEAFLTFAKMDVSIKQVDGNITADTPEVGLGSTIASGAVAVLSGTFENIVPGQVATDCDGTATVGSSRVQLDDINSVFFNIADTWAASGDASATISGTVEFHWIYSPTASTHTNVLNDSSITLTQVDQTALHTVGRIFTARDGKAYVYLQGVASCVIGSVVSYIVTTPAAATTALAITNAVGQVGVAMAAVIAGDFGWFQIAGLNLVTQCDSSAAIGVAYIGGTTGGVDHTAVVGDRIDGMSITVADASNVCGVFMTYPSCSNASN